MGSAPALLKGEAIASLKNLLCAAHMNDYSKYN